MIKDSGLVIEAIKKAVASVIPKGDSTGPCARFGTMSVSDGYVPPQSPGPLKRKRDYCNVKTQ